MANVLFTNVTVLDCTGADPYAGQVLVEGNRIKRVAGDPASLPAAGARVIDGAGAFLMPGLIDSHTPQFVCPTAHECLSTEDQTTILTARVSAQSFVFVGDVRAGCWDIPLDLRYDPSTPASQLRPSNHRPLGRPIFGKDRSKIFRACSAVSLVGVCGISVPSPDADLVRLEQDVLDNLVVFVGDRHPFVAAHLDALLV